MATRGKKALEQTDVEAVAAAIGLLDDDTFTGDSLNPALESLYAELGMGDGQEATVHITKLDADGRGNEAQIWKGDPDNYDLEQIAKKFGSGQYRVKVYVRIATGQKVKKGDKVFAWMLSPEDEAKRLNPQVSNATQPFNPADLARMIAEGIKAALPPAPVVQQVDPMSMMRNLVEIMNVMRPPVETAPQGMAGNPISMMKDMAELMNSLRGDIEPIERGQNASGNDVLLGLINKFGPLFAQLVPANAADAARQAMNPAMPSNPHQPALMPPQAVQPQPMQSQEEEDVNLKLKMGLAFLKQQSAAGGMPETYAEVVLDSVPEEAIAAMLQNPDPIAYLAQFDAEINQPPYREWFVQLFAACKEMLAEEPEPLDATPPGQPVLPKP